MVVVRDGLATVRRVTAGNKDAPVEAMPLRLIMPRF